MESILDTDDQYPYIRGLVAQTGASYTTVPYEWKPRQAGRSKNSLPDLIDQGMNGFVSTARTPVRMALFLGLLSALAGIIFGLVSLVVLAVRGGVSPGVPTIIVGLFLFGGLQLFFIGLVGEYVLSLHGQVRRAPRMFVLEKINFPDNQHGRSDPT